jgi:hypothetical protein
MLPDKFRFVLELIVRQPALSEKSIALSAHCPPSAGLAVFAVALTRDGINAVTVSTERCDHETMSHRTGGEAMRELHRNEETHERARRARRRLHVSRPGAT